MITHLPGHIIHRPRRVPENTTPEEKELNKLKHLYHIPKQTKQPRARRVQKLKSEKGTQ